MTEPTIHDTFDPSKLFLTEPQKYCISLFEYQQYLTLSRACIDFLLDADLIEIDLPFGVDWKKYPLERAECRLNDRGLIYKEWLREQNEEKEEERIRFRKSQRVAWFGAITGAAALAWNIYQQYLLSSIVP